MKKLILSLIVFAFTGCISGEKKLSQSPRSASEILQGSWIACDSKENESMQIEYVFVFNHLYQNISQWDESNCLGHKTASVTFKSLVRLGELGKSSVIKGATNFDMIPNIDLFECGLGKTAYTIIKFTDEGYSKFNLAAGLPSCDVDERTDNIDNRVIFIRQDK